eukprot:TRINITY_DN7586_c0_g1_i2.p3 TRINITY_DN7586_c0_g1~~TRINITY_DN7586_c0_g1_i2.p3  ORF type:complete len:110 (-),score=23.12 TRINITY_DN7586_c0_g1_i2:174-503(-)
MRDLEVLLWETFSWHCAPHDLCERGGYYEVVGFGLCKRVAAPWGEFMGEGVSISEFNQRAQLDEVDALAVDAVVRTLIAPSLEGDDREAPGIAVHPAVHTWPDDCHCCS